MCAGIFFMFRRFCLKISSFVVKLQVSLRTRLSFLADKVICTSPSLDLLCSWWCALSVSCRAFWQQLLELQLWSRPRFQSDWSETNVVEIYERPDTLVDNQRFKKKSELCVLISVGFFPSLSLSLSPPLSMYLPLSHKYYKNKGTEGWKTQSREERLGLTSWVSSISPFVPVSQTSATERLRYCRKTPQRERAVSYTHLTLPTRKNV